MSTVIYADVKNKKKVKIELTDEQKALRGDTSNDKPYWSESYTALEWQSRKSFEAKSNDEHTYSGCIDMGDLSDFEG